MNPAYMCCYDSVKAHCNIVTTSDMEIDEHNLYVAESINSN